MPPYKLYVDFGEQLVLVYDNYLVQYNVYLADVDRGVMHCFELRTANVDYFVGEEPVASNGSAVPVLNTPDSGVGIYLAKVGWAWTTSQKTVR